MRTKKIQGESMCNEDRRLFLETISEMKELKGEMREFKEHVVERVQKLEKKEGERSKERISVLSLVIASLAVLVNFIFNFIKHGGK